MKKLRADSSFNRLSAEQLEQVRDMLFSGVSYRDVREYMISVGVQISETSVSDYYHAHVRPELWARRARIATQINTEADGIDIDAATRAAVKQRALELALNPSSSTKDIKDLLGLVLKDTALQHDHRRIELLEQRAASADAAKEMLKTQVSSGGLSPEGLALAEEALKLL